MRTKGAAVMWLILLSMKISLQAGAGTTGADFLNIPVGAEPAALAGAYSALASNAYAPTWNPGGLGNIETTQITAQHLAYLESINYEHVGFVHLLQKGRGIGASVQYLGSPNISARDISGNSIGSFSSHYAAYSIAFGQTLSSKLSLGVTGKIILAKIENTSASAYAADFGTLYQATEKLILAGVVTNVGTKLTFINQNDSLPLAFRLGGAYLATTKVTLALEGVYRQTGQGSLHSGIEWRPVDQIALRAGYRTDTLSGLSPIAGFTAGVGVKLLGQMFSYAWIPLGELGNTQYVSILMQF